MQLTLNPQISRVIDDEVNSGRFSSVGELIEACVTRMLAESRSAADYLEDIRADVEVAILQADRGDFADFTAVDIIGEGRAILARNSKVGAG
jgi:Arc/MetJ-type ribon-helix-helix transcriptional regulator